VPPRSCSPLTRNHDRSAAGRLLDYLNQSRIDSIPAQQVESYPGKRIGTNGPGQYDLGTGTVGG
jgi:hypothetical protein